MSKNDRRNKIDVSRDLTSNPFKGALKDYKIAGPTCLCCQKEMDTRLGRSVGYDRGSRQSVRQGYICPICEPLQSEKYHKINWKQVNGKYLPFTEVNKQLEVAVFTDDELDMLIAGQNY